MFDQLEGHSVPQMRHACSQRVINTAKTKKKFMNEKILGVLNNAYTEKLFCARNCPISQTQSHICAY